MVLKSINYLNYFLDLTLNFNLIKSIYQQLPKHKKLNTKKANKLIAFS